MTQVVLVRHGQTSWNEGPGERFRGRADIPLDEHGRKQAQAAARRLANLGTLTAVYSSPLSRAYDTALIIAGSAGVSPHATEGLIDIDYGLWQGLTRSEAREHDPLTYDLFLSNPARATFPAGENLEQVSERAMRTIFRVSEENPEGLVALVSHKVVCKVVVCNILGLGPSGFWKIEQDLCNVNIFDVKDRQFILYKVNDSCHLKGLV